MQRIKLLIWIITYNNERLKHKNIIKSINKNKNNNNINKDR